MILILFMYGIKKKHSVVIFLFKKLYIIAMTDMFIQLTGVDETETRSVG